MSLFTHILHCDICGIEAGSLELDTRFGWTPGAITNDTLGIVDHRCTNCENTHGNFKQMVEEASAIIGNGNDAEAFVKKNKKRSDFDKEIKKLTN